MNETVEIFHMRRSVRFSFDSTEPPQFNLFNYSHIASIDYEIVKKEGAHLMKCYDFISLRYAELEACFDLTNKSDEFDDGKCWGDKFGVEFILADHGQRSTNMGDIIVMPDGKRYIVLDIGFLEA